MSTAEDLAVSRRALFRTGGAGLVAVAVSARMGGLAGILDGSAPAGSAPTRRPTSTELTLERFRPHVGTAFSVELGVVDRARVVLVEADGHPERRGLDGHSFSLLFAGTAAKPFADGQYALVHPDLGRFTLFLSAVGRANPTPRYEAVVNRRTPTVLTPGTPLRPSAAVGMPGASGR